MAEYVDREAALRAIQGQRGPCRSFAQNQMLDHLRAGILRIPAEDVAPVVHGRWIEKDDDWFATYYDCSVCGESWVPIDGTPEENNVKYCPSCGAKMDGGGNDKTD